MPRKRKPKAAPQPTQAGPALIREIKGTGGRPRIELTDAGWAQVDRMATALCTADEIADYLRISKRTLYSAENKERFLTTQAHKAAESRLLVRERQLDKAKSGNPVDSIWFGKQHLGQTDRNALTGKDGGPLEVALASVEDLTSLLDKLEAKAKSEKANG